MIMSEQTRRVRFYTGLEDVNSNKCYTTEMRFSNNCSTKKSIKYIIIVLSFVLLTLMTGCYLVKAHYDFALQEVEVPDKSGLIQTEAKIVRLYENYLTKYAYEDNLIRIVWQPTTSAMKFSLANKSKYSLKILWDDAAYVDVNGKSLRVMHLGTKYNDREKTQLPTVVVRNGTIYDLVYPVDYVAYYGSSLGWVEHPLFPVVGNSIYELSTKALQYKDKTFQILLPLLIDGVTYEYIFVFKINNVMVKG